MEHQDLIGITSGGADSPLNWIFWIFGTFVIIGILRKAWRGY